MKFKWKDSLVHRTIQEFWAYSGINFCQIDEIPPDIKKDILTFDNCVSRIASNKSVTSNTC